MEINVNSEKKLKECFVESFGISEEQVIDSLAYQSIKHWDSVGHMALIACIEVKFDLMLDTDDIIGMSTFGIAKQILEKYGVSFDAT